MGFNCIWRVIHMADCGFSFIGVQAVVGTRVYGSRICVLLAGEPMRFFRLRDTEFEVNPDHSRSFQVFPLPRCRPCGVSSVGGAGCNGCDVVDFGRVRFHRCQNWFRLTGSK